MYLQLPVNKTYHQSRAGAKKLKLKKVDDNVNHTGVYVHVINYFNQRFLQGTSTQSLLYI